ncbi:hypothetical protein GOP47_0028717 [Adiantum capillus-veneris]|nr:hypothetical protein GOP47_0028717 [Adiantum capillus-veneris]
MWHPSREASRFHFVVCVLKACGSIDAANKGEKIHYEVAEQGLLRNNSVLCTVVLGMYTKCSPLVKVRQVLEELPFRDVISWNKLMAGYMEQAESEQALICFKQMGHEGIFQILSPLSAA